MFIFPGDEKNQADAGADGGIGDVEGREPDFAAAAIAAAQLDVKPDKVHHFMVDQAVGEVPGDAAENQAEGDLAGQRMRIEMMAREEEREQREQSHEDQRAVVAAEEAPCGAGVTPMNEFEETGNDDFFLVSAERSQQEPFGELVQRKDHHGEHGDVAVGFLKNGFGGGHSSPKSKVRQGKSSEPRSGL
jgi:hypothetical protein